jgi:hypothetical protein
MAPSPAPTPARAPALEVRLLVAFAAGDRQAALQWAERLVHRRGVDGLRQCLRHTLLPREGAAAVTWLEQGLGLIPTTLVAPATLPVSATAAAVAVAAPEPVPMSPDPAPVPQFSSPLAVPGPDQAPAPPGGERPLSVPAVAVNQPAPAPASLRRLRSWLVDLPQAS